MVIIKNPANLELWHEYDVICELLNPAHEVAEYSSRITTVTEVLWWSTCVVPMVNLARNTQYRYESVE